MLKNKLTNKKIPLSFKRVGFKYIMLIVNDLTY